MPAYKSFAELKSLARYQMNGKLSILAGALLLEYFIIFFSSSIGMVLFPGTDVISNILYYIVIFIIQLFTGILKLGACLLYLHVACNMPCQFSDLFYGFKHSPDKAIKIQFVFAVINEICMIPYSIAAWTSENLMDYDTLLLLCVTSLLGTIAYMLVTLAIFPMLYLMLDFPNLTVMELFKKSFQIMKGNCIRYLLLQLSFVPIMFLSIFTCGIAMLWAIPYMNVTCTNFYLDIMACRNRQMQQA